MVNDNIAVYKTFDNFISVECYEQEVYIVVFEDFLIMLEHYIFNCQVYKRCLPTEIVIKATYQSAY